MRKIIFITTIALLLAKQAVADYKILINHLTTDLSAIPIAEISSVKSNLHIAYQHTSHGSQLVSGMNALTNYTPFGNTYQWSDNGSVGLDLDDYGIPGIADLSQGDYIDENGVTPWVTASRNLLDNPGNAHINVIMWSWCDIGGHDIQRYLDNMELLISEYSEGGSKPRAAVNPVTFVFMTGHANGGGEGDSSDSRNQLIRQHCYDHERVLFDFADIENYDPDNNYYLDKRVTDDLDYDNTPPYDSGTQDGNWAIEYTDANPDSELTALTNVCSSCAHSFDDHRKGLNCVLKGRGAWWMFARINGWDGGFCTLAPTGLTAAVDSVAQTITLTWTDNSMDEDSYILQRQVNGGIWETSYQLLAANTMSYIEPFLSPGVYNYRIIAHKNDDGNGSPCNSSYSNNAFGEIVSLDPPDGAPTDLTLAVDHTAGAITLNWLDNSSNEESFIIQRQAAGEAWNDAYQSVAADSQLFSDTGLAPNSYSYRVVAANSHGSSAASNTANETVLAVPATPTNLTAIGDAPSGTVLLEWNDNASDETEYRISRQVDSGAWQDVYDTVAADSNSYLDDNQGNGPLPSGSYAYRITAVNGALLSAASNVASAALITSVPAAPSNLSSTLSSDTITLSWLDNSDNEEAFHLERMSNGGSWSEWVVLPADTVSFIDSGLTVGTTYAYRVKAANSFGESAYSNITTESVYGETTIIRLQTVDEVDDAFLVSAAPDTNYGATSYLSDTEHFLIKFNLLAELLHTKVIEARLGFYAWNISLPSPPHYLDLYRVNRDWVESEVTWNNSADTVAWSVPGGDYASPMITRIEITDIDHAFLPTADITQLVQLWVDQPSLNHGLLAVKSPAATLGLKASEYNNNQRTYLEITYSPAIPGDIDDNGSATLVDEIYALKLLLPSGEAVPVTPRGDVDGNGKIGPEEAIFILRTQY